MSMQARHASSLTAAIQEENSWARQITSDSDDGTTRFQCAAKTALEARFPSLKFDIRGVREKYFFGLLLPSNSECFIYEDGAEIKDGRLIFQAERWDYTTPGTLIDELVLHASIAMQSFVSSEEQKS